MITDAMVEAVMAAFDAAFGASMAGQSDGDTANAFVTALEASGYAIVPQEPTQEMIKALDDGGHCPLCGYDGLWYGRSEQEARAPIVHLYRAMLAAAPK